MLDGFFSHVVKEHFFKDEFLFYRLYCCENLKVMNNFKKLPDNYVLKDAINLVIGL